MVSINRTQQVAIILRSQLEQLRKTKKANAVKKIEEDKLDSIEYLQGLLINEGRSEKDIARMIIEGLLVQEFGQKVASDIKFQTMVNSVTNQILDNSDGNKLLERALNQLKSNS